MTSIFISDGEEEEEAETDNFTEGGANDIQPDEFGLEMFSHFFSAVVKKEEEGGLAAVQQIIQPPTTTQKQSQSPQDEQATDHSPPPPHPPIPPPPVVQLSPVKPPPPPQPKARKTHPKENQTALKQPKPKSNNPLIELNQEDYIIERQNARKRKRKPNYSLSSTTTTQKKPKSESATTAEEKEKEEEESIHSAAARSKKQQPPAFAASHSASASAHDIDNPKIKNSDDYFIFPTKKAMCVPANSSEKRQCIVNALSLITPALGGYSIAGETIQFFIHSFSLVDDAIQMWILVDTGVTGGCRFMNFQVFREHLVHLYLNFHTNIAGKKTTVAALQSKQARFFPQEKKRFKKCFIKHATQTVWVELSDLLESATKTLENNIPFDVWQKDTVDFFNKTTQQVGIFGFDWTNLNHTHLPFLSYHTELVAIDRESLKCQNAQCFACLAVKSHLVSCSNHEMTVKQLVQFVPSVQHWQLELFLFQARSDIAEKRINSSGDSSSSNPTSSLSQTKTITKKNNKKQKKKNEEDIEEEEEKRKKNKQQKTKEEEEEKAERNFSKEEEEETKVKEEEEVEAMTAAAANNCCFYSNTCKAALTSYWSSCCNQTPIACTQHAQDANSAMCPKHFKFGNLIVLQ